MDTRDLEYLVASANAGNFTRAAQLLGLKTSTISRRIGRLEDELGLALFERGHFGVRPTSGGQAVLADARRALAEMDAVKRSSAERAHGSAGMIRLGASFPLAGPLLILSLAHWREQHPNVRLSLLEMDDGELAAALVERRLDAALTLRPSMGPYAASELLYQERLLVAVPAGHHLSERESIGAAALHGESILLQTEGESLETRNRYASLLGDEPRFCFHGASKQSILALVSAGFGLTLMPASQCDVEFPGVLFREIDDPRAAIDVALSWLPELEDAVIGRFVAFIRDEVRACSLT